MIQPLNVLIIGGVACGPKTACRLKRLMPEANITVVDKDAIVSYGACGLPYYVEGYFDDIEALTHTPAGIPRTPAFFDKAKGVTVLTRTEALAIDRVAKTVRVKHLDSGTESVLPYNKLVLATGGQAFKPRIPGIDLENVWFMTHPEHASSLVREVSAQGLSRAVMVGAGFIGMEMAEALRRKGLEVTVIEMAPQIMPGILDEDVACFAARYLRTQGVRLVLGERATAIEGATRVTGVRTDAGSYPADLVVVAVGTRPNDQLAREADLLCRDRIVVNEYCQTTDPDIYAGGDCVVNRYAGNLAGSTLFVPLGSTANKHGRVIANHIAGQPTPFSGIACTGIVKVFDYTLGRTGLSEKSARELRLDIETTTWAGPDKPHYMDAKPLIIKMIASRRDRRLLGLQVAGLAEAGKRYLDVAAATILFGGTLDQLADIDFAYAPPYSPPIEPLATCAHVLTNKLDGVAIGISPAEARRRVEAGEALVLDTRTPREFAEVRLPWDVVHIPLGALRERMHELPRDRDIIAMCKVSMRGYEAQRMLNAAGYDRVCFMEGGIVGWPYELVTGPPAADRPNLERNPGRAALTAGE
jgi:NADPH-dependent 2,4-dienoyl-CoA reductase/sulfur reductase-like enzyme/rhodanese-related sulfurtransferase